MTYFTYIIYSTMLDRYYIGSSKYLETRVCEHNEGKTRWTAKAKDWRLVYTKQFSDKNLALAREKQLKRWKNRLRIEQLIYAAGWSSGSSRGS